MTKNLFRNYKNCFLPELSDYSEICKLMNVDIKTMIFIRIPNFPNHDPENATYVCMDGVPRDPPPPQ